MEENNPERHPVALKTRKRPRRRSPSPSDESSDDEDFGEALFVEDDVVVYHSKRFNKDFLFLKCVPGGSTMVAGAFEYSCLDCDDLEKPEDVRATVKDGRFIWMDPDEPDRPHKCVLENAGDARSKSPAKRPTTSSGSAKKKPPQKAPAGSASPSKVSSTPKSYGQALPAAGKSQSQGGEGEVDDDIIFIEEVPGTLNVPPVAVKEEARETSTQYVANLGPTSELTPQVAQQRQATTVPQKCVATVKKEVAKDVDDRASADAVVSVNVAQGSGGGANGPPTPPAAGNPAPPPGNPFGGFRPVFGRAVPSGPRSVTFEGFAETFTFELAKEDSRIVNGVRVPFKMYRCRECIQVMDRASHKLDVPCVIVVNGSFVERNPELPMGTDHFCSEDAALALGWA